MMRLEKEYGGKIEDVIIESIFFSEDKRVGVGTFSPSDPKYQDIAYVTVILHSSAREQEGKEYNMTIINKFHLYNYTNIA